MMKFEMYLSSLLKNLNLSAEPSKPKASIELYSSPVQNKSICLIYNGL